MEHKPHVFVRAHFDLKRARGRGARSQSVNGIPFDEMENIAFIPPMPMDAAEARRIKQREYQAAYKARHPERVKATKNRWHAQVRASMATDAQAYETYHAKQREYNKTFKAKNPEAVKAALKLYREKQRDLHRVFLELVQAAAAAGGG